METIEIVVFIVLLVDSLSCNLIAWSGKNDWYIKHFRIISKNFPLAKGWTTYYLVLVLWIGVVMLYTQGIIVF